MRFIGTTTDISVEEMLNSYLPKIYNSSKVVKEINRIDAIELENIYMIVVDILNQFFVETATWGLELWEKEYDIPTNIEDSFDIRRNRIYTKMNARASFTKEQALDLAKKFSKKGVAYFTEHNSEYAFTTSFDVEDLISYEELINEFNKVKPAHLLHRIGFRLTNEEYGIANVELGSYIRIILADFIYLNGEYYLNGAAELHAMKETLQFAVNYELIIKEK